MVFFISSQGSKLLLYYFHAIRRSSSDQGFPLDFFLSGSTSILAAIVARICHSFRGLENKECKCLNHIIWYSQGADADMCVQPDLEFSHSLEHQQMSINFSEEHKIRQPTALKLWNVRSGNLASTISHSVLYLSVFCNSPAATWPGILQF